MKIAISTLTTPTLTLEELAPMLRAQGYDGWELRVADEAPNPKGMEPYHGNKCTIPASSFHDHLGKVQELSAANDLEIISLDTYIPWDAPTEIIVDAAKQAVAAGVKSLRIDIAKYDGHSPLKPRIHEARTALTNVATVAAEYDVRALIEMQPGTIAPGASGLHALLDGIHPKHVGVIYDPASMVHEGYESYRLGLETLGDHLAFVNINNNTIFPFRTREDSTVEWRIKPWPIHQGYADLRALIGPLLDINYDGWLVIEDFSTQMKVQDRVVQNIAFVKKLLTEEKAKRMTVAAELPEG